MLTGNKTATLQVKTTTKNEIGESISAWSTVGYLNGYLDMISNEYNLQNFGAKVEQSTNVFITPYKALNVTSEESRLLIDNKSYEITLIDDPVGMHKHLEILLQYTGGINQ